MIPALKPKADFFARVIDNKLLRQNYLFFGPSGSGKSFFARSLACFLEHGDFTAGIKAVFDSLVLGSEEKESIGIDAVRAAKNFLSQGPLYSKFRMVIIDPGESLTSQAQPAFLKIVEEPPPKTIIIFIARSPAVFLPPLLSRLNKVYFRSFTKPEIKDFLVSERGLEPEKAEAKAGQSLGSLKRALLKLKGEKEKTEPDLKNFAAELENAIVNLYLEDKFKNSGKVSVLLSKLESAQSFNLNPKLQLKALKLFYK